LLVVFSCSGFMSEKDNIVDKEKRLVSLNKELLKGLHKVVVVQAPDPVYKRNVAYEAYPLSEVLTKAYPDWKELIANDAMLIMRATGDYTPMMSFSDGFSGRAYLATNIAGRSKDNPYDCWTEGGEEHCDLGYFLIWTDGFYPERPQPWGTYEMEVVQFEEVYADAIPNTDDEKVNAGFNLYRKYCIECHRVNDAGGSKATEHVARDIPLQQNTLEFFLFQFRKNNPSTYMPDFSDILTKNDAEKIMAYIDYMSRNQ